MATYRNASNELLPIVSDLVAQYHGNLHDAGVTFEVLYAHADRDAKTGEPKGPAITSQRVGVPAKVRIMPLGDRVAGSADVRIIVDGDEWEKWAEPHQRACIDRELTRLELQIDEDGAVKLDDACRPKLRLIAPDFLAEGFVSVVERYKGDAAEAIELHKAGKAIEHVVRA
jgi:hypothetical protein